MKTKNYYSIKSFAFFCSKLAMITFLFILLQSTVAKAQIYALARYSNYNFNTGSGYTSYSADVHYDFFTDNDCTIPYAPTSDVDVRIKITTDDNSYFYDEYKTVTLQANNSSVYVGNYEYYYSRVNPDNYYTGKAFFIDNGYNNFYEASTWFPNP